MVGGVAGSLVIARVGGAALVASAAMPPVLWALGQGTMAGAAVLMTLLLWWKHRENIRRLLAGTEGRLAVVAVLLDRGSAQPLVQTIWNNLPLEKKDTFTPSIVFDPNDLLPQRRDYYTYMGSLSEPPCTEGVLWLVMKEPLQASPEQMALFSRLYPLNARPVQAAAGRMIKESQ